MEIINILAIYKPHKEENSFSIIFTSIDISNSCETWAFVSFFRIRGDAGDAMMAMLRACLCRDIVLLHPQH